MSARLQHLGIWAIEHLGLFEWSCQKPQSTGIADESASKAVAAFGRFLFYEIKHAQERNSRQVRHLTDVRKLGQVARLYGRVEERTVLYRGEDIRLKNGIRYRNVNAYLCEGGDAATL